MENIQATIDTQIIKIKTSIERIDKSLGEYQILRDLEKTTNVPKIYLALSLQSILAISLLTNALAPFTSTFIGVIPAIIMTYHSLTSLKADSDLTQHMLMYWLIFGIVNIIEATFIPKILLDRFIFGGYYFCFKSAFLIWCLMPRFKGALHIFIAIQKHLEHSHRTKKSLPPSPPSSAESSPMSGTSSRKNSNASAKDTHHHNNNSNQQETMDRSASSSSRFGKKFR